MIATARREPAAQPTAMPALNAAARARLEDLQHRRAEHERREDALRRARRSIPRHDEADLFSRYEITFERQVYRALDALDRLQRRRAPDPAHHERVKAEAVALAELAIRKGVERLKADTAKRTHNV